MSYLTDMVDAYVATALWAGVDFDGHPLDDMYDAGDLAAETLAGIRNDCADFMETAGPMLDYWTAGDAGHNLYLTRERHGAGFWSYDKPHANDLSAIAEGMGEAPLYRGDDGKLYT